MRCRDEENISIVSSQFTENRQKQLIQLCVYKSKMVEYTIVNCQ